jgi:hypothetical protein
MPGVPRELAEHKLKVYPQARPIRQKLRRYTPDKREAIRAELARLVAARFIREVLHPEWLANPVLVLKKNKVDWRMCVDYTDLNKHYPKDPFGLPRIDQVVDSTAGCSVLSFLDCYSGYHQISLAKEDEEKTAFITPFGAFCYTSMSLVRRCEACQYLSKQQHLPAQQLHNIPVTWPFACWGLDMIGPFKKAQGGYTYLTRITSSRLLNSG